ncbi:metal-dependent hydrolase [Bacillus pseudomycoides]|uniref:metal-dependent hydrolase n=1 Tax=Bacillus pseudomycoides TaxID=64104 RepID=UPI000BED0A2E|nr:metal-dependent hydrolase [Bacillus pseudomycoides]PEE40340.1 metal-dependent hydrolase [Bacillus pseudomycoides]PGA92536.1 metal-dependent hydrolase [Bacillus pseudomycoides]PHF50149.1 metal-dependent hydrolase [Bacillus pseudomycoides]
MKISYHGHSVVKIEANGKVILIDPFLTGNPKTDLKAEDVKVDVIILSHGHGDHVGDTVALAKKNNAVVVAPFELATFLGWQGVNTHPMHIGGSHVFDFGKVKFTQAFHGSSYIDEENQTITYTGMPAGILFTAEEKTVYHAGDTALFSDMKLIGSLNNIDLAFLPIGDNFTMGPEDAVLAAEWIGAKTVVPMHYNTFPVIQQDPHLFVQKLTSSTGKVLEAGESITL